MPINSGVVAVVMALVNVFTCLRATASGEQNDHPYIPDNTGRTGRRAQAAGDVPLWLLQTDALKDRVNNALWRDSPGPGYVHFPDWLGELVLRRTDV